MTVWNQEVINDRFKTVGVFREDRSLKCPLCDTLLHIEKLSYNWDCDNKECGFKGSILSDDYHYEYALGAFNIPKDITRTRLANYGMSVSRGKLVLPYMDFSRNVMFKQHINPNGKKPSYIGLDEETIFYDDLKIKGTLFFLNILIAEDHVDYINYCFNNNIPLTDIKCIYITSNIITSLKLCSVGLTNNIMIDFSIFWDNKEVATLFKLELQKLIEVLPNGELLKFIMVGDESDSSWHVIYMSVSDLFKKNISYKKFNAILNKEENLKKTGKSILDQSLDSKEPKKATSEDETEKPKRANGKTESTVSDIPKIKGVFTIKDCRLKILKKERPKGVSVGIKKVDDYFMLFPGKLYIITGIPQHGKTAFVNNIVVNTALNQKWKWAVFSPESYPLEQSCIEMLEIYAGNQIEELSQNSLNNGLDFLQNHLFYLDPEIPTPSKLFECVSSLNNAGIKINGVIIDPYSEMAEEKRKNNETETYYINKVLSVVKKKIRAMGLVCFLVAHPQKIHPDKNGKERVPVPSDISGSNHFFSKADLCACVFRDIKNGPDVGYSEIYIQKAKRTVGQIGTFTLNFDQKTQVFK